MQNSQRPLNAGGKADYSNIRISCALIHSAGAMAADIAGIFVYPHLDFLVLPPARMHLVGIALAGLSGDTIDIDCLKAKKFADAVAILADPSPIGLEGILSSLTFPMWTASSYRTLWSLLQCVKAKKILAHTPNIDPVLVSILDELPPVLREGKIVRQLRRPLEATLLARICEDDIKATKFVSMIRSSDNRLELFGKLIELVEKSTLLPIPPHIDHAQIKPIVNVHQLSRTAMYFRNCLRASIDEVVAGEVAFYVLEGAEPAVFAIEPRMGGYALTQIRGMKNVLVSAEIKHLVRKAITDSGISLVSNQRRHSKIKWSLERLGSADSDDSREIDAACREFLGKEKGGAGLELL